MANINVIGNDLTIYHAFASLANAAPGATNFNYHRAYIKDYSLSSYMQALNDVFENVSDKALGDLMVANLGLSAVVSSAEAEAYLAAATDRVQAIVDLADILAKYSGTQAAVLSAQATFNSKIGWAVSYSTANAAQSNFPDTFPGSSFALSTGVDMLIGTANADLFNAYLSASQTLNNNDDIQGGAGADTLFADLTTSAVATAARTTGIETVQLRAQHLNTNSTDNNTAMDQQGSQIDAERMKDVTTWESNNSRADLIIEDVRINANQITKDITIAMVETDPGHVDYGVYFDQLSLRNQTSSTATLALELLDTRSQAKGTGPLKDNPYNGFGFLLNGKAVVVQSAAIDDALTYADLRTAIETRINELKTTNADLANFTVTLGAVFNRYDTESGALVQGTKIVLTDTKGGVITLDPNVGWVTATGTVPPSSGIHTLISNDAVASTDLVTSKVILDDVGRGSTGGDLVIGGLSVGDTSTSKGVQRFEIEVRDNSKLQTINSTNNTLMEVTIKNGVTTSASSAYTTTVKDAGDLTVNGTVNDLDANGVDDSTNGANEPLPGSVGQHNAFGFSDVRLIDGSSMTGDLAFTAEITAASKAKYLNAVDTAANPAGDNIAFTYSGGNGNDVMAVTIDGAVIGSSGTLSAREDFTFTANGGAGNDSITVSLDGNIGAGNNWYNNQSQLNNVTLNGGDGNDTIRKPGNGDTVINAGAGDDTVYADNSGAINTNWIVAATNNVVADLAPQATGTQFLYGGKLTVTFSGAQLAGVGGAITAPDAANKVNGWEVTVDIPTGTNYAVTQYHINQAIKDAINNNAVLNKLLVAQDGPTNTLTISSKIDGNFDADDLIMTVSAKDLTTLNAADTSVALEAYKAFAANSTATIAIAQAANAASVVTKNGVNGMDVNQVVVSTGTISAAESDNRIDLGAGASDVLVLGTGAFSNDTVVFNAYDLGKKTIVNFSEAGVAANGDYLNFNSYLTGQSSHSGSSASAVRIATTLNADATVEANSVTDLNGVFTTTDTFAGLTAAKFLAAINSGNTGTANYAGITAGTLNAANTYVTAAPITLVGGIGKAVVMVENNLNLGEYKVFELTFDGTATNTKADFTAAQEIAVIDLGASVVNFTTSVTTASPSAPGGAVVVPPIVVPPVGNTIVVAGNNTVAGTAAADVFTFNAVAALADAAGTNTQASITGFAAGDSLSIDMPTASATITTLAQLNGQQGVSVQVDPFSGNTLVNFGADANGGEVVTLTLVGVADATTVPVVIG